MLALNIELLGNESPDYMILEYLESFADLFSRHRTYDWNRGRDEFFTIKAEIPVPEYLLEFDHDGDDVTIEVTGRLEGGHFEDDARSNIGFTASSGTEIQLQGREAYDAWRRPSRHYICSHVLPP